jgi:transposase
MPSIPPDLECIQAGDPQALTRCLNLPEFVVTQLTFLHRLGWLLVSVQASSPAAPCPRCGQVSTQPHQYHGRLVRDLAWAALRCVLYVLRRRFKCASCARPFTEPLAALAPYARTTRRYAARLLEAVRSSTVAAVARAERLGYKAVEGTIYRQAAAAHPTGPPTYRVTRLGVDEIAARKGHGHYKCVLVDLDAGATFEQLADRDQATLRAYFSQWSPAQRAAVTEVTLDFWVGYHEIIAEFFPQARIVGDRFHVQQHVNAALTTTRREVQRQMNSADRAWLGAHRHLLVRNEEDLSHDQQVELEMLKAYCPELDVAHTLKEELRTLYNTMPDRAQAARALERWRAAAAASGIAAVAKLAEFVARWQEPILNYFVQRTTSGVVEGLNNKIKLVKRRAFGFRNDAHFRLRVLLACNGTP